MSTGNDKRYTIAIMLSDTQSDYSEDLLRGFYSCAKKENVNIVFLMGPQVPQYCVDILSNSIDEDYTDQFGSIYNYVHFVNPDALIITYGSLSISNPKTQKEEFLSLFSDIPYLFLEDMPNNNDAPYLIADNYSGMHDCIEHLTSVHHYKKIAFLSGPKNNKDSIERLQAYYDVMRDHNLPVTDSMVTYGDYSELANAQVKMLLDQNPGLEAIACANDNMAKAAYRVCSSRDMIIGKDIAITGFDDVEIARTMTPPLTSVSHSSFKFAYTALRNAIKLCSGETPPSARMPAILHKRCSCGCASNRLFPYTHVPDDKLEPYIHDASKAIAKELLYGVPYQSDRDLYTQLIINYFHHIYVTLFRDKDGKTRMEYLLGIFKQLVFYPHLSNDILCEHICGLLHMLSDNTTDDVARQTLSTIIGTTRQYINANGIAQLEKSLIASNRQAWFVPSFTRDLMNAQLTTREITLTLFDRLQSMNVKSSYLYLFDQPIKCQHDFSINLPDTMRLRGYFTKKEMVCYEDDNYPEHTTLRNLSDTFVEGDAKVLTAFVLFSGADQYGLLLSEVDQQDIAFMQIGSLQLGSLLRFIDISQKEQNFKKELQQSLQVIQEQNNILSFISEYDELSKLLNRRGFMERALSQCSSHIGQKAYLLFADLDHLKEINDCFGHTAGDYAIRTAADRLTKCLPKDAVTARIGGDEFVSLVITDYTGYKEHIMDDLREETKEFNKQSEKPYYVEFSVGVYEFYCNTDNNLPDIISQADEILYQAKANRRSSIKK